MNEVGKERRKDGTTKRKEGREEEAQRKDLSKIGNHTKTQ